MAKGLYVSNLDSREAVGYDSKIVGQVRGFAASGLEFELISFSPVGNVILRKFLPLQASANGEPCVVEEILQKNVGSNILVKRKSLLSKAFERLRSGNFDYLYLRYPRAELLLIFFLFRVKSILPHLKIYFEYPTFPYDDEISRKNLKQFLSDAFDKLTRHHLKYFVHRAAVVNYSGDPFGITGITIDNGISTSSYCSKSYGLENIAASHTSKNTTHLVGVANVRPWHGYDRIITGLGRYYSQSSVVHEVTFHIVGADEASTDHLRRLAIDNDVLEHIVFYLPKRGAALDRLFEKCDIAISTLAPHRIGLSQLSPLKTREYCARGIPFVIGYEDPDFPDNFEYALKFESSEKPININAIVKHHQRFRELSDTSETMRKYSFKNLDWKVKMLPVVKDMKST